MRSPGGNRTAAHPVLRQWQSCHIVKDTPWADGGIGLSFRKIRWIFGVEWGIFRLIVSVKPKQNRLLFDRLITHGRRKWSSFDVYKKAGTLSLFHRRTPAACTFVCMSIILCVQTDALASAFFLSFELYTFVSRPYLFWTCTPRVDIFTSTVAGVLKFRGGTQTVCKVGKVINYKGSPSVCVIWDKTRVYLDIVGWTPRGHK